LLFSIRERERDVKFSDFAEKQQFENYAAALKNTCGSCLTNGMASANIQNCNSSV
jgi:hypothetical protein